MNLNSLVPLSFVALLTGCATGPYEGSTPITVDKSVEIASPIKYMHSELFEIGVLAGRYRGAREDAQGIYYVGPPGCYRSKLVKTNWATNDRILNKIMASDCGIYVPTDTAMPVKLFTIFHGMKSSWEVPDTADASVVPNVVPGAAAQAEMQYRLQENATSSVPGASVGQGALGTAIALSLGDKLMESAEGHYLFTAPPPAGVQLRDHLSR